MQEVAAVRRRFGYRRIWLPLERRGALAPRELDRLKLEFSANLPWLGEERRTMKASKFTEARDRRSS